MSDISVNDICPTSSISGCLSCVKFEKVRSELYLNPLISLEIGESVGVDLNLNCKTWAWGWKTSIDFKNSECLLSNNNSTSI